MIFCRPLNARDDLRQRDLAARRRGIGRATLHLIRHRFDDRRIRVAQQQRREIVHEVENFVAVRIDHPATRRTFDEQRIRAKVCAHARVATGKASARVLDQSS